MFLPRRMRTQEAPLVSRAFVAPFFGAAMALVFVAASLATEPVAHGEPTREAPPLAKARSMPSCPRMGMPNLPPRGLFERADGPRQAEAIVTGIAFRDQMLFLEREKEAAGLTPLPPPRSPAFERELPGFELVLGYTSSGAKAGPGARLSQASRVVSAAAGLKVPLPWGRDFRAFVDRHRSLFGVRADGRVRLVKDDDDYVHLEYPNGAVSDGFIGAFVTRERVPCREPGDPIGHEIRNNLPVDEPQLSAEPALSAEEALQRFHDIAPYVSTASEPPVRLVVASSRTGAARLVWRVSYHYDCWWWYQNVQAGVFTQHLVADVDAFSGSLL